jgi:hypothetical protein
MDRAHQTPRAGLQFNSRFSGTQLAGMFSELVGPVSTVECIVTQTRHPLADDGQTGSRALNCCTRPFAAPLLDAGK